MMMLIDALKAKQYKSNYKTKSKMKEQKVDADLNKTLKGVLINNHIKSNVDENNISFNEIQDSLLICETPSYYEIPKEEQPQEPIQDVQPETPVQEEQPQEAAQEVQEEPPVQDEQPQEPRRRHSARLLRLRDRRIGLRKILSGQRHSIPRSRRKAHRTPHEAVA